MSETMFRKEDAAALLEAANALPLPAGDDNEPFEVDPRAQELPDTTVSLPGGFLDDEDNPVFEAEVRELTGLDEEAIAKATSVGRALQVILERGLVSVGGQKPSRDTLDRLLLGDRDAILLGIRKATYGHEVEYGIVCYGCGHEQTMVVDLSTDVKVDRLADITERYFTVRLRNGTNLGLSLPDGKTHRDLLNADESTVAEMNTLLLGGCILSLNDLPVSNGLRAARDLGIVDRQKVTEEISKRSPGPRWDDVIKNCSECDAEVSLSISLTALFRF